ncbi:MAG: hypothetical protein F4X26_08495, partial [Chloroflexi bacterium]|nr:hypothetical protein [Chloroflexota bacterium]
AETEVGGDAPEYTREDADVGSTLKVRVTYKDDAGGTEGPLESAETVAVLAAAEDCETDRPHADWCTTMTVGIEAGVLDGYGYRGVTGIGSLVDDSFDYGGLVHVVEAILTRDFGDTESVFMAFDRELPAFTVYDLGGREITIDEGRASFTDVLTSGLDWLEGQEVTVSLNRRPGRETATVDGNTLTLAYGEDLDEASVPAEDAYTVTVDGSEATVSDVDVSGDTVTLTLGTAVMPRQTVTVNYTPGADPVQDESGLDAAGFMNKAVENETLDTTAPAFSSAQVDGTTLVIAFDEELAAAPNLANGAFTVKRTPEGDAEETVGLAGTPSISGATVTLTLAAAVLPTDTDVKVSYEKPSTDDGNRLEDAAGNEVADFTDEAVTIGSGPATGAPSVSGPPQVGKTLTAEQGTIADLDELPATTFPDGYEFQWFLMDGDTGTGIPGATSRTYVPVASDVAKALRVRVTFTDGEGNPETLTSDATYAVMPAADLSTCPGGATDAWCATLTVGHQGSSSVGFESSSGRGSVSPLTFTLETVVYTVTQLQVDALRDVHFSTDPDLPADGAGLTLHLQNVSGERDLPLGDARTDFASDWWFEGGAYTPGSDPVSGVSLLRALASDDPLPARTDIGTEVAVRLSRVLTPDATGAPGVAGVPQAGRTLAAGQGTIADDDDLPGTAFPTGYAFQWARVAGDRSETDIPGADSWTYVPVADDVGGTLKVRVSFADGNGTAETLESAETAEVAAAAEDCTADRPHADWCTEMTVGFQAGFNDRYGYEFSLGIGSLVEDGFVHGGLPRVVEGVYILEGANDVIAVHLDTDVPSGTVFDLGGTEFATTTEVSQSSWPLPPGFAWLDGQEVTVSANLPPTLVDAEVDGNMLTLTYAEDLDEGSVPAEDAYAVTVDGGAPAAPTGVSVSGAEVTLTLADEVTPGQAVTLSYAVPVDPVQDESGLDAPAFSGQAVKAPGATGRPSVSGPPQAGQTLTAGLGTIADADGLPTTTFPTGYTFQWVRVDGMTENDISGATSRTYTLTANDVGKTVKVKVSFTDGGGTPETVKSAATAAVVAAQSGCASRTGADWCTTMTAGYGASGTIQNYGVGSPANGTLDQTTFSHGGTNYTVTRLAVVLDPGFSKALEIRVTGGNLPTGAQLEVDGRSGAFILNRTTNLESWELLLNEPPFWLDGQKVTVSLNLPPVLTDATVDGNTLTLTHAEDLDTGSTPGTGAYAVTVEGSAATVSNVSIGGDEVTLTLATAVTVGQTVLVSYTAPGTDPVQDESGLDAPSFSNQAVTNATGNTPPTAASNTVTMDEDTTYTFSESDFGFMDADGDALHSVRIRSLEREGDLEVDGVDVTQNQVIDKTDIDDGKLTFTPAANEHGASYTAFSFVVSDGTDESSRGYLMTINVNPVNDPPTAASNTVTTAVDTAYAFAAADFGFSDIDGDPLASVRIKAVETDGDLELDGAGVAVDQVIQRADIDAGDLIFTPHAGESGDPYATFRFMVGDGTAESVSVYTMTVDV